MQSTDEAIKLAHEIGFPVMIKVAFYFICLSALSVKVLKVVYEPALCSM